jgi:hypothetical protein
MSLFFLAIWMADGRVAIFGVAGTIGGKAISGAVVTNGNPGS